MKHSLSDRTVSTAPTAIELNAAPEAHLDIRWFRDLRATDTQEAGGKGANLGELVSIGMPTPPGFVITAGVFGDFLEASGLSATILQRLAALNVDDGAALRRVSDELGAAVRNAVMPEMLQKRIVAAYDLLEGAGHGPAIVAVRSSATLEDMPGASFAGMNETFLNVRGGDAILNAVKECWASLYGARVIFYRRKQEIAEERMAIAVIVQEMVESQSAGVMFTVNPANGDRRTIVIEGSFGLGDTVVSGSVSPDHWEVSKDTLEVTSERIASKHVMTFQAPDGSHEQRELTAEEAARPCISAERIREIAELGRRIEEHYGAPQDIEWAVADEKVYIVQSRPVTAMAPPGGVATATTKEPLVRGLCASPGVASGVARVLKSIDESDRLGPGGVLVARKTEPDWTPIMKRAAAIVTDEGGMTAHAAIVSRELGIPCLVGTQQGTRRIPDGETVTVDARNGVVYPGRFPAPIGNAAQNATGAARSSKGILAGPATAPVTATRLYVNLAQPEMAETIAAQDVDGVGLLRIEFMVQEITNNTHPRKLLLESRGIEFRDGLAERLARFARAFAPRPVVARTTDFRTNEYRNMVGGAEFEPEEANPMIGYRGAFRYVKEPDLFRLELEAFRTVREEMGMRNLALMVPFVRMFSELRACRRQMDEAKLSPDDGLPLWVMAEVPSVIYRLPDYVKLGVSGVSIGSNDLTQLMLGVDRDSETLAPLFDERDPGVLSAIHDIIRACRSLGITCSICGQAPSVYPEITEKLVEWGIDSISVNPDALPATRRIIAASEQRLLIGSARRCSI